MPIIIKQAHVETHWILEMIDNQNSNNKKISFLRSKTFGFFLGLAAVFGYAYWEVHSFKAAQFGFEPPEMARARYAKKDVIGNLGGMKVRIPRYYAEYVQYDGDPGFGGKRNGALPDRTFDSRLSSFGIEARFPGMKGLEDQAAVNEYKSYQLNPDNPWISISINAGEFYPGLGARARDGQARNLGQPSEFWFDNHERLPSSIYGLEAYVPIGADPKTGKPARLSDLTKDIYVFRDLSGHVDTYISCGRTLVPRGVVPCHMRFGLEPEAEVSVSVAFHPKLLKDWSAIRQASTHLLLSFKVNEADPKKTTDSLQNSSAM